MASLPPSANLSIIGDIGILFLVSGGKRDALVYVCQRRGAANGLQEHGGSYALIGHVLPVDATWPGHASLHRPVVVIHHWQILGHEDVVGQCWQLPPVAPEFFAPVKGFR